MKRRLPTPTKHYEGPDSVDTYLRGTDAHRTFSIWAHIEIEGQQHRLRLERITTLERPGTKVVQFSIIPQGVLLNGRLFFAHPSLDGLAECDWSNFLRLVRWRKAVASMPPEVQCRIARLTAQNEEGVWGLVAVDDLIRREGFAK